MRRSVLALSVIALLLGACGGGGPDPQEEPQAALTSAFDSMSEAPGVTATFSLRSNTDSLISVSEGAMSEDVAQKILDSSFTVTTRNETDPADAQSEISADVAGIDDAFEMKMIGSTMYLRGDVRGLMETFGADPSDADQFVADGRTAGIDWAEPAVDGEWLQFEGLDDLAKQFGAPSMEETAAQQREMFTKFSKAMEQHARAEPGNKEGPGDHLIVTINLRDIYASLQDVMGSLGGMAGAGLPPASEVPDEDVRIDVWIEDDFVRQMELDFIRLAEQFVDEPAPEGAELALRIAIEGFDGDVEAPEGATKVDAEELSALFAGAGAGGAPGGQPTDICEQLKGAPPEVIEQFAQECPELQS